MRTYSRNVRRAWDGEDYRPPKRQRLDGHLYALSASTNNENAVNPLDLEDNLERAIRETSVAALSSSPSRKNSTIFSLAESQEDEHGSNTITPPSSPPPPALQLTPPNVKARKPTFSFLDKNKKEKEKVKKARRRPDALSGAARNARDDSEPLSEILNSSSRAQTCQPATGQSEESQGPLPPLQPVPTPLKPSAPKQLVQTILDLGQPLTPTMCPQCQMPYHPSQPEDVQLHNMFHNRHSAGIELGKPFLKSAMRWCYEVSYIPGAVVVVDRKIAIPGRKAVQRVLEIVNKELGSIDIKEEDLWSQRAIPGENDVDGSGGRKCDRYKAFLHVVDGKCVGVCLAERIAKAHRVLPSDSSSNDAAKLNGHVAASSASGSTGHTAQNGHSQSEVYGDAKPDPLTPTSHVHSSSIRVSEETYPAVVGVSRIWTSKAFRRKGIANNLLDCVMNQFIYGMDIDRSEVAFSQPTESGAALARAWFGEEDGWAVYKEE